MLINELNFGKIGIVRSDFGGAVEMQEIYMLLDYFLKVNEAKGEGFSEDDINAHLRAFYEILQNKINHPFPDGGPELDCNLPQWRSWVSEHGAHVAFHYLSVDDKYYRFGVVAANLTNHGYVMDWYSHARDYEGGLYFMFHAAIADSNDANAVNRHLKSMKAILLQSKEIKAVLEHLKDEDAWTYLIPNIRISVELKK